MSLREKQGKAIAALTAFGALVAVNYYFKPAVPKVIGLRMNQELDRYNSVAHPGQDPM